MSLEAYLERALALESLEDEIARLAELVKKSKYPGGPPPSSNSDLQTTVTIDVSDVNSDTQSVDNEDRISLRNLQIGKIAAAAPRPKAAVPSVNAEEALHQFQAQFQAQLQSSLTDVPVSRADSGVLTVGQLLRLGTAAVSLIETHVGTICSLIESMSPPQPGVVLDSLFVDMYIAAARRAIPHSGPVIDALYQVFSATVDVKRALGALLHRSLQAEIEASLATMVLNDRVDRWASMVRELAPPPKPLSDRIAEEIRALVEQALDPEDLTPTDAPCPELNLGGKVTHGMAQLLVALRSLSSIFAARDFPSLISPFLTICSECVAEFVATCLGLRPVTILASPRRGVRTEPKHLELRRIPELHLSNFIWLKAALTSMQRGIVAAHSPAGLASNPSIAPSDDLHLRRLLAVEASFSEMYRTLDDAIGIGFTSITYYYPNLCRCFCSTSLLQADWTGTRPFLNSTRCSYGVEFWMLHLKAARHDLMACCPTAAASALASILVESLTDLYVRCRTLTVSRSSSSISDRRAVHSYFFCVLLGWLHQLSVGRRPKSQF
eukprot:gnl/Spiro4/7212_TR3762_c0_g1_i1.p1 gnl/Spiro4/7212_TR3762_c0_g1~~gnl/Spiro4/7212_TR3762_c0_g1_i1.p1  ORF type:complete len:560 (-),score=70.71 gnl/Spiro4/7212_TR3762_c0_g1_i1:541-2196(-)